MLTDTDLAKLVIAANQGRTYLATEAEHIVRRHRAEALQEAADQRDQYHAENARLRARLADLADWHDIKADKARRFRPEVDGVNRAMDKVAEVHTEAALRLHALADEGNLESTWIPRWLREIAAESIPRGGIVSDHIPTTAQVREEWQYGDQEVDYDGNVTVSFDEAGERFDRWLAERARQVRRAVAEEIAQAIEALEGVDRIGTARWPEHDRDIYSLAIEEAASYTRTIGGSSDE